MRGRAVISSTVKFENRIVIFTVKYKGRPNFIWKIRQFTFSVSHFQVPNLVFFYLSHFADTQLNAQRRCCLNLLWFHDWSPLEIFHTTLRCLTKIFIYFGVFYRLLHRHVKNWLDFMLDDASESFISAYMLLLVFNFPECLYFQILFLHFCWV